MKKGYNKSNKLQKNVNPRNLNIFKKLTLQV